MTGVKGKSGGKRPGQGRPRKFSYTVEYLADGRYAVPCRTYAEAWQKMAALSKDAGVLDYWLTVRPVRS